MEFVDIGALIPIAGILAGVAFGWIGLKHRQLMFEHKRAEREATLQGEEKRRLEQRLAVIERIMTDRGLQTAKQIEALREGETAQTGSR